jgi:peptidoglycan-associated lipoprotein
MTHPWVRTLTIGALIVVAAGAGCARRPVLGGLSAPAPTGAAAPEPAPVAPAPVTPPTAAVPPVPAAPPAPPPRPPAPRPAEFREVRQLGDIHFDFDRSAIRPDAAAILAAHADWIKSTRGAQILIEGHCDERGTNEYNIALGDRRARAARDYLVAHGIAASRITTITYGEERPVCAGRTESCWARNRRAHFLARLP